MALFSVVAIAAIVSGVILIPQMAKATTDTGDTSLNTQATDAADTSATQEANELALPSWNNDCYGFGARNMRFRRHGFGGFGSVEISDEFKQTVVNIAENDTDVQNLINDGYNATTIRPILKTVIDEEGNVVTKASTAILTLQKDTTGYASVTVNIDESKVTQIIILTRTVIDKP